MSDAGFARRFDFAHRRWRERPPSRIAPVSRIAHCQFLIAHRDALLITVHHLNHSRSQRVLWLLEELEIPYEIRYYQRDPRTLLAPPELRAVHPLGKAPVVTIDNAVLAETGAIVESLLERFGNGRLGPPSPADRERFRYWMYYAEGSAMTPLLLRLLTTTIPRNVPFLIRPLIRAVMSRVDDRLVRDNLDRHADLWEQALTASEWFAGDAFSAADILMSFPLETGATRLDFSQRPHIEAFLKRIHARPAYRRALERGGPYRYA